MGRRTVALLVLAGFAGGSVTAAFFGREPRAAPPKPHPVKLDPPPQRRPRPQPPATVTIAAVGDITLGRTPSLPVGGAGAQLRGVRRPLTGDIVLGNLETTLATGGYARCVAGSAGCFTFRAPPEYARGLRRAGFTILNLANNHAYDFGASGQAETVAALDRAGLRHTGRPGEIAYVRVGRVRVAVVGFAPYRWAQSLLDLAAAQRLVRRAARRADLVVATMHAGAEGTAYTHVRVGSETYLGEPRGDVTAFAHAVVGAGADLVVGHGPHVLRGLEWYHGRLIAYSLGNFSSHHTLSVSGVLGVSAVLQVTLRRDGLLVHGHVVPVRLVGAGAPVVDRDHTAWPILRSLSRDDFGRHGVGVSRRGDLVYGRSSTQSRVKKSQNARPAHGP